MYYEFFCREWSLKISDLCINENTVVSSCPPDSIVMGELRVKLPLVVYLQLDA